MGSRVMVDAVAAFFFNDTATTEIYTLSLHDALPICRSGPPSRPSTRPWLPPASRCSRPTSAARRGSAASSCTPTRSEEHTSELQSRQYLVCRLLLEKKKTRLIQLTSLSNP